MWLLDLCSASERKCYGCTALKWICFQLAQVAHPGLPPAPRRIVWSINQHPCKPLLWLTRRALGSCRRIRMLAQSWNFGSSSSSTKVKTDVSIPQTHPDDFSRILGPRIRTNSSILGISPPKEKNHHLHSPTNIIDKLNRS